MTMMTIREFAEKASSSCMLTVEKYGEILVSFDSAYYKGIADDLLDAEIDSFSLPDVYMHKPEIIIQITGAYEVSTLADLQLAMNNDEVTNVILEADITGEGVDTLHLSSGTKVLDLNGHNILAACDIDGVSSAIMVENGALLMINGDNESVVNGGTGSTSNIAVMAKGENTRVLINAGVYNVGLDANGSENSTVYATEGAEILITDGLFKNDGSDSLGTTAEKKTVINRDEDSVIAVSGGTFKNQDPAEFLADGVTVEAWSDDADTYYQAYMEVE